MIVWRISEFIDLEGRGGLVTSGRWHRKGQPVVYAADHPATAMLEVLVHLRGMALPPTLQLLSIDIPDGADILSVSESALPADWRSRPEETQQMGVAWLREGIPFVAVPSALVPHARNVLINPVSTPGAKLRSAQRFPLDVRFAPLSSI
jgi:RES domain-containing protein